MKSKKNLIPLSYNLRSNILHFVFTPNLWFSDDDGYFVEEKQYPTKDNKINKAVKEFILSDKLHYLVESLVYDYKVLNYYFKNNLLQYYCRYKKEFIYKRISQ